jgi:predicted Rossmann-fold nucleotide-binding protein
VIYEIVAQQEGKYVKYKIGVFGSNVAEHPEAVAFAKTLGAELAQRNVIIITGACSGMPYIVASESGKDGAEVWGFSPELNEEGQKKAYPHDDITIYSKLFYVPQNYRQLFFLPVNFPDEQSENARLKYRNVISTVNADAGIIISGSRGSLNEFTNLLYEGKPIGVLTGTGGLADELPNWFPRLRKKSESKVFFNDSPHELVSLLLAELEVTHLEVGGDISH